MHVWDRENWLDVKSVQDTERQKYIRNDQNGT